MISFSQEWLTGDTKGNRKGFPSFGFERVEH